VIEARGFKRIGYCSFGVKREPIDPYPIVVSLRGHKIFQATIKCFDEGIGSSVFAAETLRRAPFRWKWDVYGPRFSITLTYKQSKHGQRKVIKQSYRIARS
jgi:hypothetical protein